MTEDNIGNKWSHIALRKYFEEHGIDGDACFKSIHDVVIKTLIAAEGPIGSRCNRFVKNRSNVFELFGFDVMLGMCLVVVCYVETP